MRTLVLPLLLSALLPLSAIAQISSAQQYVDVSSRLQQILSEYSRSGLNPSSERLMPLVSDLTDISIFTTARNSANARLFTVRVCGAGHAAVITLMNFCHDPSRIMDEAMGRNTLKFQESLLQLMDFLTVCYSVQISEASSFMEHEGSSGLTDSQFAGARQARSGVEEFLHGAIAAISENRFDERRRQRLLDTLARTAPTYAESLTLESREKLRRAAEQRIFAAPIHFRLNLRRIADAMKDARCNAVCKA